MTRLLLFLYKIGDIITFWLNNISMYTSSHVLIYLLG